MKWYRIRVIEGKEVDFEFEIRCGSITNDLLLESEIVYKNA